MGQQSLLQAHAIGAPHMRLQRSGGHVIRQDADVLRLPVEALAIGGNERLVGNRGIVAEDVLHNAQPFHRLASLLDEVRGARPLGRNQRYIGIELAGLLGQAASVSGIGNQHQRCRFWCQQLLQHALQIGVGRIEVFMGQHFAAQCLIRAAEFSEPAVSKGAVVQIDDNRHRLDACIEVVPGVVAAVFAGRPVAAKQVVVAPAQMQGRCDRSHDHDAGGVQRRKGRLHRHGGHRAHHHQWPRGGQFAGCLLGRLSRVASIPHQHFHLGAFEQAFGFVFVDGDQHPVAHGNADVRGAPCHLAQNADAHRCGCGAIPQGHPAGRQCGNHSTDSHPCDGFDPRVHAIPF